MAGESTVNEKEIERRATELETKEQEAAETPEQKENLEDASKGDEGKPAAKTTEQPKPEAPKPPNDPSELRKWSTKLSMENAEMRKQLEHLANLVTKSQAKKIDWKELSKDPVRLEKLIEEREQQIVQEHTSKYEEQVREAAAEITAYENKSRFTDPAYPRWGELNELVKKLAFNQDSRVNFNQHPKMVLDELYDLAVELADKDPNYKKPESKPGEKTYSQAEYEAALAKAKEEASAEANAALRNEGKGAGVGSMGKGSTKGKPGAFDKDAAWNMPLSDLKRAIQNASPDR